jgi:hypothetical protein
MIYVVNKYKHVPTDRDIYIGRGSALGNPFTSIQDRQTKAEFVCGSREEFIASYAEYLSQQLIKGNREVGAALNKI